LACSSFITGTSSTASVFIPAGDQAGADSVCTAQKATYDQVCSELSEADCPANPACRWYSTWCIYDGDCTSSTGGLTGCERVANSDACICGPGTLICGHEHTKHTHTLTHIHTHSYTCVCLCLCLCVCVCLCVCCFPQTPQHPESPARMWSGFDCGAAGFGSDYYAPWDPDCTGSDYDCYASICHWGEPNMLCSVGSCAQTHAQKELCKPYIRQASLPHLLLPAPVLQSSQYSTTLLAFHSYRNPCSFQAMGDMATTAVSAAHCMQSHANARVFSTIATAGTTAVIVLSRSGFAFVFS
jgi:hypothetical protein